MLGTFLFSDFDRSIRWAVRSWELLHTVVREAGSDEALLPAAGSVPLAAVLRSGQEVVSRRLFAGL